MQSVHDFGCLDVNYRPEGDCHKKVNKFVGRMVKGWRRAEFGSEDCKWKALAGRRVVSLIGNFGQRSAGTHSG